MKNNRNKGKLIRIFICQLNELDGFKEYLEKKAAQGWMLEKRQGFLCHFIKCEPKEIRFSVEVFEKSGSFEVGQTQSNEEYIEYCKKAGWSFVCAEGKVQIFYAEDKGVIPIETDAEVKLKSIRKSMFKANILNWTLMPLIGVLYFYMNVSDGIVDIMTSYMSFSTAIIWGIIICLNLYNIVSYFRWYLKMKKKIHNGETIRYGRSAGTTVRLIAIGSVFFGWIIGGFVAARVSGESPTWLIGIILGTFVVVIGGTAILIYIVRRAGVNKRIGQIGIVVGSVIIAVVVVNIFMVGFILSLFLGWGHDGTEIVTYKEVNGSSVISTISQDELPLKLEDLGITINGKYDLRHDNWGRFFISQDEYYQSPMVENSEAENLNYTIYQTQNQWLYQAVLREKYFENKYIDFDYKEVEMGQFQGDKVYYFEDEYGCHYLVLYNSMILDLQTNFKLDDKQMKTVADHFIN